MRLLNGIRQSIGQSIRQKFKSAIPFRGGDRFLLGMFVNVLSRRGIAERAFGEVEVFAIKAGLFLSGVELDPSAYDGVGTVWKEDTGQRHYDPDARVIHARPLPHALNLPHGFYIPVYLDHRSPFLLRREHGTLYLYLNELRLFPVEFERRPAYYSLSTSTGVPMGVLGPHRLQRQVLFEYNAYCDYFSQKTACLFCGITAERPPLHNRYGRFAASPAEIAEVVEAAYREETCSEMQLTGGVLPGRAEVQYFVEVGRAVKERLGVQMIPNSQAVLVPPPSFEGIDALKEAGWKGVSFNLEVWDERLWGGFVPGKATSMSRERWLESLEYAVGVFGKGNVASVLIAGLEPKRSHWAGVEWLAERGIYGVPIPLAPAPGSAIEGHQTPTAAWHIEVVVKDLDIWERYGLEPERHSSGGLHYADLARMRRSLKREQQEQPGRDFSEDPRYRLAVQGKLPEM